MGLLGRGAEGSAEFIGFLGLHIPIAELPFSPCVEIGWRLAFQHWHRGLARRPRAVRSRWASTGWIWRKSSLSPRSAISVRARSCNESACARRAASSIRAYPSVIHFAHTACTVFRRWTIGRSGLQATEPRPNTLPPTTWSWSCPSCCSLLLLAAPGFAHAEDGAIARLFERAGSRDTGHRVRRHGPALRPQR